MIDGTYAGYCYVCSSGGVCYSRKILRDEIEDTGGY